MKSTHKLTFKSKKDLTNFSFQLFFLLDSYKSWLRDCTYFARKNILYVDTAGYTGVEIFINNNSNKYNYTIQ